MSDLVIVIDMKKSSKIYKEDRIKNRFNEYVTGKINKGIFDKKFVFEETLNKWTDITKNMTKEELLFIVSNERPRNYNELGDDVNTNNKWLVKEFNSFFKNYDKVLKERGIYKK